MSWRPKLFRTSGLLVLAGVILGAAAVLIQLRRTPGHRQVVEAPRRQMEQREGRWRRMGDSNAFTGVIVDIGANGAVVSRVAVSNGLANGWCEMYFTNGRKSVREYFKDGVSDGLRQKWFENGCKMSEARIVNGKVTGLFRRWYDNGQLAESMQMRDGQPEGLALAYYPSGFVRAETTIQNGRTLQRNFWKDGQFRQN